MKLKQNGITLISLVVTIIVLIILAGVSINLVLGDNGIITIAKKAKENTEFAKIEEEIELNELYTQLSSEDFNLGNLPYDSIAKLVEFKIAIANAIDEAGGVKPDSSAETSVFANNIKGIVKEVTKDATATANDISEGKTAWVDGKLITGTSTSSISSKTVTANESGYWGIQTIETGFTNILAFHMFIDGYYYDFEIFNILENYTGNGSRSVSKDGGNIIINYTTSSTGINCGNGTGTITIYVIGT